MLKFVHNYNKCGYHATNSFAVLFPQHFLVSNNANMLVTQNYYTTIAVHNN